MGSTARADRAVAKPIRLMWVRTRKGRAKREAAQQWKASSGERLVAAGDLASAPAYRKSAPADIPSRRSYACSRRRASPMQCLPGRQPGYPCPACCAAGLRGPPLYGVLFVKGVPQRAYPLAPSLYGVLFVKGVPQRAYPLAPSLSLFATAGPTPLSSDVTVCALPSLCAIERTAAYEAGLAGRGQGRQPPKAGAKPALTAARARPKSSADRWPGRHGAVGMTKFEGSPRMVARTFVPHPCIRWVRTQTMMQ
jgi:hypothetical protein